MAYEELPPVEEAKALLVKPAPPVEKVPARGWRAHWLCLFGLGSPEDVTACCLAYNAPCVAFGWNHRRGLGLGFWREGLKFVGLVALCYLIMRVMSMVVFFSCAPQPMPYGDDGLMAGPDWNGPGAEFGGPGHMGGGGMMMGGGGPGGGGSSFSSFNGNMGGPRGGPFGDDQAMPMSGNGNADQQQAMAGGMPKGKPCDKAKHGPGGFPADVDPAFMADVAQRAAINTVSAVAPAGTVEQAVLAADDPTVVGASEYSYAYGEEPSYYVDERPNAFGPGRGDPFADGFGGPFDGPFGGGPHDPMMAKMLSFPKCVHATLTSPGMLAMAATLVVAVCYMVYFMALRRRQLRERFGIPGSFWHDYCLWAWCGLCALAQETRTMMHNNVHEGIWYGEVPAAAQLQCYTAPAAQQFGSGPAAAAGPLMV